MPKKPRSHIVPDERPRRRTKAPRPTKTRTQIFDEEFRQCSFRGGCPNIVSVADKPRGYSGRVFCILHRGEE